MTTKKPNNLLETEKSRLCKAVAILKPWFDLHVCNWINSYSSGQSFEANPYGTNAVCYEEDDEIVTLIKSKVDLIKEL